MIISRFVIDNSLGCLQIEFSDNQHIPHAQLTFEYLRISDDTNTTKKNKSGQVQVTSHKKNVRLLNIESVSKHGYRFIFDDGYQTIFSEHDIQQLVLEYDKRWQNYLQLLKNTGHSREAMINVKQL